MPRLTVRSLQSLQLQGGFALVYAATILVSLTTRFNGGVASMWLASGVLAAMLAQRPPRQWTVLCLIAMLVNVPLTSHWGLGPIAALPLAVTNIFEAALLALAIQRWAPGRDGTLRSIGQVGVLVVAGGIAAAATGVVGALIAHGLTGTSLWGNWVNWTAGHALGTIAFMPVAMLVLRGDAGIWWRDATTAERSEAGMIGALVFSVAVVSFGLPGAPLLFLPLLPVMLATFRMGRIGAALSLLILAGVSITFTLAGEGPIMLLDTNPAGRVHFLQFYLAAVVLTVLPAAADLRKRQDVFHRLATSEARYRLVTENASDVILNLDSRGGIRFVSPSIEGLGDFSVEALTGSNAARLIHPADRHAAREAHVEALRVPGMTQMVECRTAPEGGKELWIEMRLRAVRAADQPDGVELICSIRDISKRKAAEVELTRAARTDPLTGLANRRVFNDAVDAALERVRLDSRSRACVAIFDIDLFKRINDSCGHDGGDRVLRHFAMIAEQVTRGSDLVARLGGEEFGLVLPGTDEAQARAVCERLRQEFAAAPTLMEDGSQVAATVSAGVARIGATSDRDGVMRDADVALYAAKRGGRDRLVLAA